MGQKIVVTIARQYGSGGRYVGKQLAEKLGCPFYDKAVIRLAAEESGIDPELFREAEESPTSGFWNTLASNAHTFGTRIAASGDLPLNDRLFIIQSNIVKEIAAKGSCVIVGRCADYILHDDPSAVHIFVHGTEEDRISRLTRFYDVRLENAREIMHKIDKRRASYYNYYTGQKWGQAENYHLSINSSVLGVPKTVEVIATFARLKNT